MTPALRIASLALAIAPAAPGLRAFEADPALPAQLQADRVEVDRKTATSRYRGNVTLERGGTRVHAEQAEVQNRAGAIEAISARGAPLRFQRRAAGQPELRGVAARLEYRAAEQRVSFYGAVRLERGADTIVGEAVHYYPVSGALQAGDESGPVRMILHPRPPRTTPGSTIPAAGAPPP